MKTKHSLARLLTILTTLVGIGLIAGMGWACMRYTFAGAVSRLSYDLPFAVIRNRAPEVSRVVLVYMDEEAEVKLGQTFGVWDRKVHAKLIRRLTQDGARAVFFDIVFLDPSPDPSQDEELAAAMKENGRVFIGASLNRGEAMGGITEQVFPPTEKLAEAAADYGLLVFQPVDADYGVRYLYAGTDSMATATWLMAMKLGAPLSDDPEVRALPRWINYYGPIGVFDDVVYDRALRPDGVPPGFFKDKIVFVGGRSKLGTLGLGKDEFSHPTTRWTAKFAPGVESRKLRSGFAPGVEIHATVFLNLLRGEWLVRWSAQQEEWFALGFGLVLAILLPRFRPVVATALAVAIAAAVTIWAGWLVVEKRTWFAWAVPVMVQTPLAIGWAVGTRYFLEERRRNKLRKAFGHYLSEDMADRIADANFDLTPGGEIVEATIIFTDLQGFTSLSENLGDPRKLSEVLIAYFTNTTQHVLENRGTIIKYIGDAVLAVWGAPLADPEHAMKATLAAWRMHEASEKEVLGHKLTTRVGVHTGEVLAGNLGSSFRFDYTVIGDAVNLASRLEGLNKYLGTRILLSDTTASRSDNRFIMRRLGDFKVVGKDQAIGIHELLGPVGEANPMPWLGIFARGVASFCRGDLDDAERHMHEVRNLRAGHDGPAEFYLEKIKLLRSEGLPPGWTGAIEITSK